MPLLIGADPEFFLKKDQKYVSAYGKIPGTKRKPYKVEFGAVQVDGTAAEINIKPASSPEEFVYHMSMVKSQLQAMIPDCEIVSDPTAKYDVEYLSSQPEESLELGCDPDYNAYTMLPNPRPMQHPTMRSAGGHFHLGYTKDQYPFDDKHFFDCAQMARQMDFFVGLPSVILDEDKERKQLYGMAGAFRPKKYGMEYRTASNFWTRDPELMMLMYENINVGYNLFAERRLYDEYGERARDAINNNDIVEASLLCEEIGIPLSMQ